MREGTRAVSYKCGDLHHLDLRASGHDVIDRFLDLEARMNLADQQLEIRLPSTESCNRALRDVGQLFAELGELGLEPVDGSVGRGVVESDGVEGLVGECGGKRLGDGDAVADEYDMSDLILDEDCCPFAENVPEHSLLGLALGGEAVERYKVSKLSSTRGKSDLPLENYDGQLRDVLLLVGARAE